MQNFRDVGLNKWKSENEHGKNMFSGCVVNWYESANNYLSLGGLVDLFRWVSNFIAGTDYYEPQISKEVALC